MRHFRHKPERKEAGTGPASEIVMSENGSGSLARIGKLALHPVLNEVARQNSIQQGRADAESGQCAAFLFRLLRNTLSFFSSVTWSPVKGGVMSGIMDATLPISEAMPKGSVTSGRLR